MCVGMFTNLKLLISSLYKYSDFWLRPSKNKKTVCMSDENLGSEVQGTLGIKLC